MEEVFGFFTYISDWLESGVYDFVTEAYAYGIKHMVYGYLQFINWVIPFAWAIGKEILEDLNFSQHLESAWSNIPAFPAAVLSAMKVPEAIAIIVNGYVTRFVLRFIPGV